MVKTNFSKILQENQRRIGKALDMLIRIGDERTFMGILSQVRYESLQKAKDIQNSPLPDLSSCALLYLDAAFPSLILRRRAKHLLRKAENCAFEALKSSRTSRDPNEILAVTFLVQGRKEEAEKHMRRALEKLIKRASWLSRARARQEKLITRAAFLFLLIGDADGAQKILREIEALSPTKNLIQHLVNANRSGKRISLEKVSKRHLIDVIDAIREEWHFKWYWYLRGTFPLARMHRPMINYEKGKGVEPLIKYEDLLKEVKGHFITSDDACMLERIFIGKFESKMRDYVRTRKVFPTPWNGERVSRWVKDAHIKVTEELAQKSIFKVVKQPRTLGSSEKRRLVVQAVFLSHASILRGMGFDEQPLTLKEFLGLLKKEEHLSDGENHRFHVIGISSPTGWDENVIDYIAGKKSGRTLTTRDFLVILVDQFTGDLYYYKDHPHAQWYSQLFKPETDYEGETKVREWVKNFYDQAVVRATAHPHVLVSEILKAVEVRRETCLRVLNKLESAGFGKFGKSVDEETVLFYLKNPKDWRLNS